MKGETAPGPVMSTSQLVSPCHLPQHETQNFCCHFFLRTLCRVVVPMSFYPLYIKIILLWLFLFVFLCVFFLMCVFPIEDHLGWQSGCPFNTKAEKEILSLGSRRRGCLRRRKRLGLKAGQVKETLHELFWPLLLLFYIKCTFHSNIVFM